MANPLRIRINNVNGSYEHWVQVDNQNGYWASTLYESTVPISEVIKNRSSIDAFGNIRLFEEYDNEPQTINLQIKTYNVNDQNKYLDTVIIELIDTEVTSSGSDPTTCQYFPIVGNIYYVNDPSLNSETGIQTIVDNGFVLSVTASNPCGSSLMNYFWLENGKKINLESLNPVQITYDLNEIEQSKEEKTILCKVENLAGSSISNQLNITVHNPYISKYFNKNLIKNGDASEGMGKWIVAKGTPKTYPGWNNFNNTGFFSAGNIPELQIYDPKFPDNLQMRYFTGGEGTPDNAETIMYQIIDISDISDLVDKKVVGVENGIYANMFGIFGKRGTSSRLNSSFLHFEFTPSGPGYILPGINNETGHYFPLAFYYYDQNGDPYYTSCRVNYYIGDKSKMKISFLDEAENEIDFNDSILRTNNFIGLAEKIWLRRTEQIVPIGTRKIKIEVKFQKDFGVSLPTSFGTNLYSLGFTTNEVNILLKPGSLFNVRHWEEKPGVFNFFNDHLSMATFLNLELGIVGKIHPHISIPLSQQTNGIFYNEIFNRPQTTVNLS